jgi:hypothetical protein
MTSGTAMSARVSGRARGRPALGWAARLGRSRARVRARERAVWLGRTAGKKKSQPDFVFVFLFQINE